MYDFNVRDKGVYFNETLIEYCKTKDHAKQLCSLLALVLRTNERDIKGPFFVDESDIPAYLVYNGSGVQVNIIEGLKKPLQGLCSMLNLVVKQTKRDEECLYNPSEIARSLEEIEELGERVKHGKRKSYEAGIREVLEWLRDENRIDPLRFKW